MALLTLLPKHKTAIFVHGCFWHGHEGCKDFRIPKTRVDFWENKISTNRARDLRNIDSLRLLGWKPVVIWACEMKNLAAKAALSAGLPALVELTPVTYSLDNEKPLPMAADETALYRISRNSARSE